VHEPRPVCLIIGTPDAVRAVRDKLISTEPRGIEPRFRVTLLSKRYKPRFDEHPSAVGALRDLAWMEIVENFRAELKKKKLRLDDLEDYAAKHPSYTRSALGSMSSGLSQEQLNEI